MTGHQHTDDARASTRKLTYEDFLLFPDDGQRHELIEGEHYVTPSPNLWHQELSKRLTVELELHLPSTRRRQTVLRAARLRLYAF